MTLCRRILLVLTLAAASTPAAAQEQPRAEGADSVCIPTGRGLAMGVTRRDAVTGDSTVVTAEGVIPWRKLLRRQAEGRRWFTRGEPIELMVTVGGTKGKAFVWGERPTQFLPFSFPRRMLPGDSLVEAGVEVDGVPVYVEQGYLHQIQYLPMRPDCWFQPYQQASIIDVIHVKRGRKPYVRRPPLPARAPLRRDP